MNEVKRYAIISDDWDYVESPSGGFVDHDDYAALRQQRDKLAEVLGNVEREHELLRRMKNCEILRGRGSFGIAVMSDTHAIEWQALDKELQQLIDARHTALVVIPVQQTAVQKPVVHACTSCAACEGLPASNNNPCYVCGGTVSAVQNQGEMQKLHDECEYLANENIELKMLIKNMRQHKTDYMEDAEVTRKALESELSALKAQQVGQELDELRRACAEILGQDPEAWPSHGNAPLAIASALALAVSTAPQPAPAQPAVHPDDAAVDRFAAAMKAKLAKAREKGRGGWDDPAQCSVEFLAKLLVEHLTKGNAGTFEDVANFAMMLHQRGADPQVLADAAAFTQQPSEGYEVVAEVMTGCIGKLNWLVMPNFKNGTKLYVEAASYEQ